MMRMPDLAPALKLACTVILVTCLGLVPRSLMERRLEYGKVAGLEVFGQGLGDISSVIFAFAGLGLWSLVAGFVAGETIKTIGFWVATRWRPNLRNVRIRNLTVWKFGSFVTADRILTYFSLNVDRMIIGRVLGAAAAGYYALAFEMIAFPAKRFSALVGRVLFSSLSRAQDQLETAADIYLKTIRYVSLLTVPAIAGLAVLAPEVSRIIYGPMADAVAPLLRLLCPAGIVFAILTPTGSLLYSQGRPDLSAKWSLLTMVVVFLAVSLGSDRRIALDSVCRERCLAVPLSRHAGDRSSALASTLVNALQVSGKRGACQSVRRHGSTAGQTRRFFRFEGWYLFFRSRTDRCRHVCLWGFPVDDREAVPPEPLVNNAPKINWYLKLHRHPLWKGLKCHRFISVMTSSASPRRIEISTG